MAKSKKSNSGKITPFPASHAAPPKDFVREKEQMLRLIQEKLSTSDMSMDESNAFLSGLQGQKMEDIIAGLGGAPQTDLDRANDIIWDVPEDASDAAMKKAAKKALAISEDCMGAWLILSEHAKTDEEAIDLLSQGIACGRKLHASIIASAGEDHGLWGCVEARDFMRLLHELATAQHEIGDVDAAANTYREMLRLNPNDNQGVRGELLHLLIILDEMIEAKALLKRYKPSHDLDTGMVYGCALMEIIIAMARLDEDWPERLESAHPKSFQAFRKILGAHFPPVEKAVKAAVKANPYVPMLMGLPGIMETDMPEMMSVGGPYAALDYIQRHAPLWAIGGLPFLMLATCASGAKALFKNPSPREMEELQDIMQATSDFSGKPWWDEVIEGLGA